MGIGHVDRIAPAHALPVARQAYQAFRGADRLFGYRALRFGRADATPLPGFDENAYVPASRGDSRPLDDLLDDWRAVRSASITLFRSLDAEALGFRGFANDSPITPRALAWIICGHELHHRALFRERYGL